MPYFVPPFCCAILYVGMVYLLSITLFALASVIVFLMVHISRAHREHERKMQALRQTVLKLSSGSDERKHQLMLSEELMRKLRSANDTLGRDLVALVSECVEMASGRNPLS